MIYQVTQTNTGWTVGSPEYAAFILEAPFQNTKDEWTVIGHLDKVEAFSGKLEHIETVLDALYFGMKHILAAKQRKASKWYKDLGQI